MLEKPDRDSSACSSDGKHCEKLLYGVMSQTSEFGKLKDCGCSKSGPIKSCFKTLTLGAGISAIWRYRETTSDCDLAWKGTIPNPLGTCTTGILKYSASDFSRVYTLLLLLVLLRFWMFCLNSSIFGSYVLSCCLLSLLDKHALIKNGVGSQEYLVRFSKNEQGSSLRITLPSLMSFKFGNFIPSLPLNATEHMKNLRRVSKFCAAK